MRIDALEAACAAMGLAACAAPPDFVGRAAEPIAWPSPTASPRQPRNDGAILPN